MGHLNYLAGVSALIARSSGPQFQIGVLCVMSVPCKNIDDPGLFQIIKSEPATSPTNNALAAILVPSMNGQWSLS